MKSVGIFGGSFDPVHFGHLITTSFVYESQNLEKIIFVPNYISPLKTDQKPTEAVHRINMLKLAIEQYPFFDYSDFEIMRDEISYTVDTLLELKKKYQSIELIIGFDNLVVFDKWRSPEKIFEMAKVIVMKRKTDVSPPEHNKFFDRAVIIDTPTIDISSTEIRNRVKEGRPIDYLVPEKVKEYIYRNRLYK